MVEGYAPFADQSAGRSSSTGSAAPPPLQCTCSSTAPSSSDCDPSSAPLRRQLATTQLPTLQTAPPLLLSGLNNNNTTNLRQNLTLSPFDTHHQLVNQEPNQIIIQRNLQNGTYQRERPVNGSSATSLGYESGYDGSSSSSSLGSNGRGGSEEPIYSPSVNQRFIQGRIAPVGTPQLRSCHYAAPVGSSSTPCSRRIQSRGSSTPVFSKSVARHHNQGNHLTHVATHLTQHLLSPVIQPPALFFALNPTPGRMNSHHHNQHQVPPKVKPKAAPPPPAMGGTNPNHQLANGDHNHHNHTNHNTHLHGPAHQNHSNHTSSNSSLANHHNNNNNHSMQPPSSASLGGTPASHHHHHHHHHHHQQQQQRGSASDTLVSDLTEEEHALLQDIRRRKAALLMEIQNLKEEICTITNEMSRLESASGTTEGGAGGGGNVANTALSTKQVQRNKQLSIGRKRFNLDPKKGIEYLQQHGLIGTAPLDVANFLFKGEGLNKTAIGEYLGEKNEFNENVLAEFVALHDFTNLILVQALRQFLWSFRLPGEAQKIDRMMERFAQRYCAQNEGMFSHSDVCYVLSFSVIMLNTSLHNPAVRDKPSLDTFVSMNRGINNGADLPRELLASLYESIKHEPFKIPEDDGNDLMDTFFNPDREGWLWKQGGRVRNWKRRWFIIKDKCLYYFEYTTDKEPRGIIPLENVRVRDIPDSKSSKNNSFELVSALGPNEVIKACKTDTDGKVIEGKHTCYRMAASTPEEKTDWMKCVQRSISHSPFYDMLAARKKKIQDN